MACMVEALGLGMPQNAAIPASDSRRLTWRTSPDAASLRWSMKIFAFPRSSRAKPLRMQFASTALSAGRQMLYIHSLAMAGRTEVPFSAGRLERAGQAGSYLLEPYAVGSVPHGGLLLRRRPSCRSCVCLERMACSIKDAMTVNGKTIWENSKDATNWNPDVIRSVDNPLAERAASSCCEAISRPMEPY